MRNDEAAVRRSVVCGAHELIEITSPLAALEIADDSAAIVHSGVTLAALISATSPNKAIAKIATAVERLPATISYALAHQYTLQDKLNLLQC